MQLYFSHSYRDVSINTYFIEQFRNINTAGEAAGRGEALNLCADQKSDTWCVAKLERYLFQLSGFVSVIPRRLTESQRVVYSEYIAYELTLARRARTPRLLFVDDQVLRDNRDRFPEDAVPFLYEQPESEASAHEDAIRRFKRMLQAGAGRPPRAYRPRQAIVVVPEQERVERAAKEVEGLLRSESYNVSVVKGRGAAAAFDNIRLLEALLDAELCVFLLGEGLSFANLVLAMAHAQCIPSIRFQYDPRADGKGPDLSGLLRWKSTSGLIEQFKVQLHYFRRSYVLPLERSSSASEAARATATTEWHATGRNAWDPRDGPALVAHVRPDEPFVADRVSAVSTDIGGFAAGRDRSFANDVCRRLYEEIRRRRYYYELEPRSMLSEVQMIRTPNDVDAHRCGTCLDLACLFASLVEAAHLRALIVIVGNGDFAHALAGYFAPDEVSWDRPPLLGELRAAVHRQDAVLFEATGAVEAEKPVAGETEQERRAGAKTLDFTIAKEAAERVLARGDIEMRHVIDVGALRQRRGG